MRSDPGLFKPVHAMSEPTREFTPSMDYRHLLSPETLARLIEREAKRSEDELRAERTAEIESMNGQAIRAKRMEAERNGDNGT